MLLNRLKKRKEFVSVAKAGHKVVTTTFVLQAMGGAGHDAVRAGFTVTKKVGNAVVRNRIRRRMRAAAAEVLPQSGRAGYDYVLIGRGQTLDTPYEILLRDLSYGIKRLNREMAEVQA